METVIIGVVFILAGFLVLGMVRVDVVYRARMQALDMIDPHVHGPESLKIYYSYPNMPDMVGQVFAWSFDGLFPGYKERLKGLE